MSLSKGSLFRLVQHHWGAVLLRRTKLTEFTSTIGERVSESEADRVLTEIEGMREALEQVEKSIKDYYPNIKKRKEG